MDHYRGWIVAVLAWASVAGPPSSAARAVEWIDPGFVAHQYTVEDGLPVDATTGVRLGPDGFLWVATFDGLARFDGERFVVYRRADYPELPTNRLVELRVDGHGAVWLWTVNGRAIRWKEGRFERLDDLAGVALGNVQAWQLDGERDLWLATATGVFRADGDELHRICRLEPGGRTFDLVPRPPDAAVLATRARGLLSCDARGVRTLAAPRSRPIVSVAEFQDRLWFCDFDGLYRLDGGRVTEFAARPPEAGSWGALAVHQDTLWLGGGRAIFRLEKDHLVTVLAASEASGGASMRFVQADRQGRDWVAHGRTLYRDGEPIVTFERNMRGFEISPDGTIWVATDGQGLTRLQPRVAQVFADQPVLTEANLYAVAPSSTRPDRVWLGGLAASGSLLALDGDRLIPEPVPSFAGDVSHVWTVLEDSRGTLWLGGEALCRVDRSRGGCDETGLPEELTDRRRFGHVRMLMEDSTGAIWVGTTAGPLYRLEGEEAERIDTPTADAVHVGLERRDGSIWLGTNGSGLLIWRDGRLRALGGRLESRLIRSLYEDASGTLWVGTEDVGLLRLETDDAQKIVDQRRFGTGDGLWDDVIHSVVEDAHGRLWMSSNRGVFWIEREALDAYETGNDAPLRVVGYTEADGLLHREANGGGQNSGMVDARGRIWFPGQRGVMRFDPREIEKEGDPPPSVVIESVSAGDRAWTRPASVELPAARRDLTVRYAAPVFRHADRSRFRYRMVGYDTAWVDGGRRSEAPYTNLPAGEYRFEVEASDGHGRWSPLAASLAVIVPPRFYERGWFLGCVLLTTLALTTLAYRSRVAHLRARAARLESMVAERTRDLRKEQQETEKALAKVAQQAQRLRELDSAKSRFFTNLSHELRTPLTLILGPAEQALGRLSGDALRALGAPLRSIRGNAERLLDLVSQILVLSRLEAGYQELQTRGGDLAHFCREVLSRFTPLATQKGVELQGPPPGLSCVTAFDHDVVDKILANLLSNALRHTPAGTAVGLALRQVTGGVVLTVSDQGPGIAPERLDRIFDRFYSASHEGSGAGIGLAMARELANLHGGSLSADSRPGRGSTFKLVLPLEVESWEVVAEAEAEAKDGAVTEAAEPVGEEAALAASPRPGPRGQDGERTTVLVVEDEPEVCRFVEQCLDGRYRVLTAEDGRTGLQSARRELPDVIVSDIMMPQLDGTAMVRTLSADPTTTGIPVIFLTARSEQAQELEGLEAGAVDYLTKPFAPEILVARVERMLSFAHRLREQLRVELASETEDGDAPRMDSLVERIERAVRRHLTDPDLNVERLAREANTSRSHLKRLLADAGLPPPSMLIRERRLDEAARLLARGRGSVTEVAYATGFQALSNFARRFRERFGVAPSDYLASRGHN